MSKHTPGPWKVVNHGSICIGVGCYTKLKNYSRMIVNTILPETDEKYELEKAELEANARLIAAAPEMLELLEEACAESETHLRDRITELLTRINPTT